MFAGAVFLLQAPALMISRIPAPFSSAELKREVHRGEKGEAYHMNRLPKQDAPRNVQ